MEAVQCNQSAVRWLASHQEMGTLLGAECWSLLLTDYSLSIWPWWVDVHVAGSLHNFHPCHHSQFVHEPIGQQQRWLRKEADRYPHSRVTLAIWLLKFSAEFSFWWAFTKDTNIFMVFSHSESLHISLSQISLSPVLQTSFFQVLFPAKPINQHIFSHLAIFLSKQTTRVNQAQIFSSPVNWS